MSLNILMVTPFYPPHIGGIEYHVENLSKCLAERGHNLTILTSILPDGNLQSRENYLGSVDIVRLKAVFPLGWLFPSLSSQGFTFNIRETIAHIVERQKIDVVHAHGHHYYLSWRAIAAARGLAVPSVLTLHGLYALNPTDTLANIGEQFFNYTIFRRELGQVAAVIGLTPRITEYARKYGSRSKMYFTISNGVNHQLFTANRKNRFKYRQKYGIDNDQIVVLFRGRFASIKGVLELAQAAKFIVKKNNRVFVLFVGGGQLVQELAEILKPIKENAKIIGWTHANEIHELYIASDIFILPSKSEALPITILEAMAAQLHIVTTPVGGIPDVLQTYPYRTFIKQPSPLEICEAILDAITQTHEKLAETEHQPPKYIENFDWRKIAYQVEKVYHEAIVNENNS